MKDMATSCFFTQNLLSDFLEGILPSSRHEEIKNHVGKCKECHDQLDSLKSTVEILKSMPGAKLSPEMSLRIAEAAESRKRPMLTPRRVSQMALAVGVPVLLLFALSAAFPNIIPLQNLFGTGSDEAEFTRYFPLMQGAAEILEEQGDWLHTREPMMGSLWEEGGLSPEEFEKSFQVKVPKEPVAQ